MSGSRRNSSTASVTHQMEYERRWLARQDAPLWPLDQLVLYKQALNPMNLNQIVKGHYRTPTADIKIKWVVCTGHHVSDTMAGIPRR